MKKLFLFICICLIWPGIIYSQNLKIHFLDVGEGDSILIEIPKGKAILIDTGNPITVSKVIDYLEKNDIRHLEYLILTHPHLDHIGGVFWLSRAMPIRKIYDNCQDLSQIAKSQDIYRWYQDLIRGDSRYNCLTANDKLIIDGVMISVLWPPRPLIFSDFNTNSLVIMVKYNDFRGLFTGDLTAQAEAELLNRKINLTSDILKVPHHGAADASSKEFLGAVSPEVSIISVNKDNIRGYPNNAVLDRLKEVGSKIYRTDQDGNIIVTIDNDGNFSVKKQR